MASPAFVAAVGEGGSPGVQPRGLGILLQLLLAQCCSLSPSGKKGDVGGRLGARTPL